MDYKELLKKYIAHVKDWEGISFIEYAGPFSPEELWELTVLAKETGKEDESVPEVAVRSPQWVASMQYALLHDLEKQKQRESCMTCRVVHCKKEPYDVYIGRPK